MKKQCLSNLLDALEVDSPENHSEHLKEQVTMLANMLKSMDLDSIIILCETEPDFFSIFGETEDCIMDWKLATKARIEDILIRASKQVCKQKSAIVWFQEARISKFQWRYPQLPQI